MWSYLNLATGIFELMTFQSRSSQHLVRAVSTALVVALVMLLTPCCEVFAVPQAAGAPENTDTHPAHHDDGDAPLSGEHCAPWFDQAFIPASEAALLASEVSGIDAPLPYTQTSVQCPRMIRVTPRAGAPPPTRAVYLLTSRFLL
jgi:hypothetical protein